MNKRSKPPVAGRPHGNRLRKRRALIVTNGAVTEREYFELLKECYGDRLAFEIPRTQKGKSPAELARYAATMKEVELKESQERGATPYSAIFVVTDTDQFTGFQAAEIKLAKSKIGLILSNPCFEVWLIDHVKQCPFLGNSAIKYEKLANDLGLTMSPGGGKRGASRAKEINKEIMKPLMLNLGIVLENAGKHCSKEKQESRKSSADCTSKYINWTDMPALIKWVIGEA